MASSRAGVGARARQSFSSPPSKKVVIKSPTPSRSLSSPPFKEAAKIPGTPTATPRPLYCRSSSKKILELKLQQSARREKLLEKQQASWNQKSAQYNTGVLEAQKTAITGLNSNMEHDKDVFQHLTKKQLEELDRKERIEVQLAELEEEEEEAMKMTSRPRVLEYAETSSETYGVASPSYKATETPLYDSESARPLHELATETQSYKATAPSYEEHTEALSDGSSEEASKENTPQFGELIESVDLLGVRIFSSADCSCHLWYVSSQHRFKARKARKGICQKCVEACANGKAHTQHSRIECD